jgi:concentrative nucleoside transporter, CNT family
MAILAWPRTSFDRTVMTRKSRVPRPVQILWVVSALLLASGLAGAMAGATASDAPAPDTAAPLVEAVQAERPAPALEPAPLGAARDRLATPFHQRLVSLLGLLAMLVLAWGLSTDRRRVPWRVVAWGMGLQFVFALFILRTAVGIAVFAGLNDVVIALLGFATDGARFLFGNLVDQRIPVTGAEPGAVVETGAYFAFTVLPTIVFFSSLMTVLYHLGIMQWAIRGMAWVMTRTMRTSGAETFSAAGNIFVGQTEAPLLIRPYVERMTMSELMAVMTAGFATVAGGVLAAYVGMLVGFFPDIAGHLIAASVMSAPAALVVAKLMYPEREEPVTRSGIRARIESDHVNVIDAAAEGAGLGLRLAFNVGAMLLAFIALIAMLNAILGAVAGWVGLEALLQGRGVLASGQSLTFEVLIGWLLAPLAWIMGVPWADAPAIGSLLGVKTVANEFVAYLQLAGMLAGEQELAPRSIVIATYALAGFANFGSIAIQIGGIGAIAPSRRADLSRIGLRAMVGGALAAFLTATIAGILL